MAYSWEQQIYPTGSQNVNVNIAYLDKSFIYVYLDGVLTTNYAWASDSVIRLDTPLTKSTEILLVRRTNREYLFILFASGAPFISGNLDTQNTQFLHLAQEMVEGRSIEGFYGDVSMNGYRITNLGTPVDAADAVNKEYVDSANALQDNRILTLEGAFNSGLTTAAYPYRTVLATASTSVSPPYVFDKAELYLNGVHQSSGFGYTVANNTITFSETVPAGTEVYAILGENILPDEGYVSAAQFSALAALVESIASQQTWFTTTTEVTDVLVPGIAFTYAELYINGVAQTLGYSYELVDSSIMLANPVPAGTHIMARIR